MTNLFASDGTLLRTGPHQKPLGRVTIDWRRAPRGLHRYFLFESEACYEYARSTTLETTAANRAFRASARGPALYGNTGSGNKNRVWCAAPGSQNNSSYEAMFYYGGAAGGVTSSIVMICDTLPSSSTFSGGMQVSTTGVPTGYVFAGGATLLAGNAMTAGTWNHLVVTIESGVAMKIYQNGVQTNSVAIGTPFSITTPIVAFGSTMCNTPTAEREMDGDLLYGAYALATWTADEVLQRFLDPFAMFVTDENELPAIFAAGGTSNGVGAASGLGTATGVSASTFAGLASSSGIGAATGIAASIFSALASSNGVGTATGIGSSTSAGAGVGAATGIGTAAGVGGSTSAAIASANGLGSATGISLSLGPVAAVASSSGTGTALGISPAVIQPSVPRLRLKGSRPGVFRIS